MTEFVETDALMAILDGDIDRLTELLSGMTKTELYELEDASETLGIHCRHHMRTGKHE